MLDLVYPSSRGLRSASQERESWVNLTRWNQDAFGSCLNSTSSKGVNEAGSPGTRTFAIS